MPLLFSSASSDLQNAARPWSFQQTSQGGDEVLRFEVRPGDVWRKSDKPKERSEISSDLKLSFGQTYTLSYSFMVESGVRNTQSNIKIGQLHGTPDASDSANLGPVFALQLDGERLKIVLRSDAHATTTTRPDDNFVYTDATDLTRGKWYDIRIDFRLSPEGQGLLDVWRDGVRLVHYLGPLGYNDDVGPYWKEGIYRSAGVIALAVDFKNTTLAKSGGASGEPPVSTTPTGPVVTQPPTEPPAAAKGSDHTFLGSTGPDRIVLDGHNDTVYADGLDATTGGNDVIAAGKGNDVVFAGPGDDVLQGEAGNDLLFGEAGNDVIDGGSGNDVLRGGSGDDVFVFSDTFGRDIIEDFGLTKDDRDRIQFNGDTFASFAAVASHMAQQGADVIITLDGNNSVTLLNTSLSSLTADKFIFG